MYDIRYETIILLILLLRILLLKIYFISSFILNEINVIELNFAFGTSILKRWRINNKFKIF